MILVADSHVSVSNQNAAPFFEMLDMLARLDRDLVFMGDIFELWVSLPRYEESIQKRFLRWCKAQSARRRIGFVEGNHEFFVAENRSECFSWAVGDRWQDRGEGLLLTHGDQINQRDKNYLRFRKITKNPYARSLARVLPFGASLVHRLNRGLKKTNKDFRIGLPRPELAAFAEREFADGFKHILVGHFHQEYRYSDGDGRFLQVLPDWFSGQRVSLFDRDQGTLEFLHWQDLEKRIP